MANEIVLRAKDHPEANGRQAKSGEKGWTLRFPLETGTSLVLLIGETSFNKFREFLGQYTLDVAAEMEEEVRPLNWVQRKAGEWFTTDGWRISLAFGDSYFVRDPTGKVNGPYGLMEKAKTAAEARRMQLVAGNPS